MQQPWMMPGCIHRETVDWLFLLQSLYTTPHLDSIITDSYIRKNEKIYLGFSLLDQPSFLEIAFSNDEFDPKRIDILIRFF